MSNLIETWLAVVLIPGMTVAQAVRDLNEGLGTAYEPQRLYQWRRGDVSLPRPVQSYMMRVAVSHALHEALGLNPLAFADEQLDILCEMLEPPKRRT